MKVWLSDPSRRKRFQIHLSTAIVMMFVAGGCLWINVNGRIIGQHHYYGWPIAIIKRKVYLVGQPYPGYAIIFDVIVMFALLLVCWFLCEWIIRRRAARKAE